MKTLGENLIAMRPDESFDELLRNAILYTTDVATGESQERLSELIILAERSYFTYSLTAVANGDMTSLAFISRTLNTGYDYLTVFKQAEIFIECDREPMQGRLLAVSLMSAIKATPYYEIVALKPITIYVVPYLTRINNNPYTYVAAVNTLHTQAYFAERNRSVLIDGVDALVDKSMYLDTEKCWNYNYYFSDEKRAEVFYQKLTLPSN